MVRPETVLSSVTVEKAGVRLSEPEERSVFFPVDGLGTGRRPAAGHRLSPSRPEPMVHIFVHFASPEI